MQEQRLIIIDTDLNKLQVYLNYILYEPYDDDYELRVSLGRKLSESGKQIEELSIEEINEICEYLQFGVIKQLYNLVNDEGEYVLPMIYTSCWDPLNNELYCLGKFGTRIIDIFSKSGKLIFEDASNVCICENDLVVIEIAYIVRHLYKYDKLQERLDYILDIGKLVNEPGPVNFSESKWFYRNGYLSEDFKPMTPFCFDNGKEFSEGLAAVCLNGKWGYINHKSEVVIDFQFGDAEIFENGQAWVFQLNEEYKSKTGEWTTYESNDFNSTFSFNENEFESRFPKFPKKVEKPLRILRGIYKRRRKLIEEYHDFSKGINDGQLSATKERQIGQWILINTEGQVIPANKPQKLKPISNKNHITEQEDDDYHEDDDYYYDFKYYDLDNDNPDDIDLFTSSSYWLDAYYAKYYSVHKMPDYFFIEKEFVMRVIKLKPDSFNGFASLYCHDAEVCDLAFELDPGNFSHFTNVQKDRFRDQYEEFLDKKEKERKERKIEKLEDLMKNRPINNYKDDEDDDLPFEFFLS